MLKEVKNDDNHKKMKYLMRFNDIKIRVFGIKGDLSK